MKYTHKPDEKVQYDVIIIGRGPVGYSAAMYAGRLGLKTLIIGDLPGGTVNLTHVIENYPGFISISGVELGKKFEDHAKEYDIDILSGKAEKIEKKKDEFIVTTKKTIYKSKTILFSTGSGWRKLDVPGSKEYDHKGISYCAVCMPPEEDIITNSNINPIGEVTPTMRVLSMDGTYKDISGFSSRNYKGKLISIRPRFFNEYVSLTPEHPGSVG